MGHFVGKSLVICDYFFSRNAGGAVRSEPGGWEAVSARRVQEGSAREHVPATCRRACSGVPVSAGLVSSLKSLSFLRLEVAFVAFFFSS